MSIARCDDLIGVAVIIPRPRRGFETLLQALIDIGYAAVLMMTNRALRPTTLAFAHRYPALAWNETLSSVVWGEHATSPRHSDPTYQTGIDDREPVQRATHDWDENVRHEPSPARRNTQIHFNRSSTKFTSRGPVSSVAKTEKRHTRTHAQSRQLCGQLMRRQART